MTKWTIEAENATALRKQQRLSYQETHKDRPPLYASSLVSLGALGGLHSDGQDFTESIQAIMGAQKALKDKARLLCPPQRPVAKFFLALIPAVSGGRRIEGAR